MTGVSRGFFDSIHRFVPCPVKALTGSAVLLHVLAPCRCDAGRGEVGDHEVSTEDMREVLQ